MDYPLEQARHRYTFAMTTPSLNMSCGGIGAYLGSFSIISGEELVQLMKNIGSQAKVYAFC
ncbi:conjugative relaxosome accessory transposon family protein [Orientia chuto str. Dubai]|uniref:Conjugative relaxosome accessory transposon family protein n=1 Tax=Orientia chuto str. Dubai TaxID=1359168 RepID=A0A0F3MIT7_9RICK|nr:conjugal transfer protein TraH [Candidatus Orientia mediorientalis]KJV55650.1 conjugative relaxosome accessory transposon family protein [Orientia chuto str. Dubai]